MQIDVSLNETNIAINQCVRNITRRLNLVVLLTASIMCMICVAINMITKDYNYLASIGGGLITLTICVINPIINWILVKQFRLFIK